MKNIYFKVKKIVFILSFLVTCCSSIYATNLVVASFPADYSYLNGTYVPNTIVNGYNSWVHQDGGYYIYYNSQYSDWEINTTGENSSDYYAWYVPVTISSPVSLEWTSNGNLENLENSSISVTEEDALPAPEIDIIGNTHSISDNETSLSFSNHTKFGSVDIASGSLTQTFTIENNGTGPLTITSISLSGDNVDQFTTTDPLSSTVAIESSTTFTVIFSPTSVGTKEVTITIISDDEDEATYDYCLSGYGYTPDDLVITGITGTDTDANTNYIHQGVFSGFEYWKSSTGYYIYNNEINWYIDTDLTTSDILFSASDNLTAPSVLDVTDWTLQSGTGIPVVASFNPNPNISLLGNSNAIEINDDTPTYSNHTNFSCVDISSGSRTRTYTIENTGGAELTISSVTLSGVDVADFSYTNPLTSTIAAYSSTTFTVTFNPTTDGTKYAAIEIISNDSDESPYSFTISGDGYTPEDLAVSGITGTYSEANGTYIFQGSLYEYPYWKHESLAYYIYNDEFDDFRYWNIDIDFNDESQYFYSFDSNGDNVSPVSVTTWRNIEGEGVAVVYRQELPSLAVLSPNVGPPSGGIIVTISGNNFNSAVAVNFNSTPAASFTIISDTEITATSPAGTGTVDVMVTNSIGTSSGLSFTYDAPIINTISPDNGSAEGGTVVSITGSNFTGATAVNFANIAASSFTVISDFEITATSPAGAGITEVTVVADDIISNSIIFTYPNPVIAFFETDVSELESVSSNNIQVNLSAISGSAITVDYAVSGTATGNGTDYTLADGTLSIGAGDASATITLANIVDDLLDEDNETVIVTLSNPVNATLGTNTVYTYTITDDDEMPTVAFELLSSNGLESVISSDLQVELSAVSSFAITVDYAVSGTATGNGADYTLADGTLSIGAGNASATITLANIVDDLLDEYNETIIVTLSNPVNATLGTNTVHTYTITDNDEMPTVAFELLSSNGLESVISSDLSIELSVVSSLGVTVDYAVSGTATGNGTDYVLADGTLSIGAGDANATITLANIVDDLLDEDNETVTVTLSNPVNATLGTNTVHTYTITDNDEMPTVAFELLSSNGQESVISSNLPIYLSAVSSLVITVDYAVSGTATRNGTDYTLADGTLSIGAGDVSAIITLANIVDDLLDEDNETVIVTLSNPINATLGTNTVHTYTITDNDEMPTVAFEMLSSNGLESVISSDLKVELSAISGYAITVDYAVSGTATGNGTDYTLADGTLSIGAGDASATITLTNIVDDFMNEDNETVIVTLSNPVNASLGSNTVHTYTITDDDIATEVYDYSNKSLTVYPNPCVDNIYMDNVNINITHIMIIDLVGRIVFKGDYEGDKCIDVTHLQSGMYMLILLGEHGEKQTVKIVKE